jgi:hypothetical protein
MSSERHTISITDIVDPSQKFKPEILAALREFRHSKPWRGTVEERGAKFLALHEALRQATGLNVELGIAIPRTETTSVASCYVPRENKIVLKGKLSVITYLWLFRAVQTREALGAYRWAVSLFRRVFPRSFARLNVDEQRGIIISLPLTGADNGPRSEAPDNTTTPPPASDTDMHTDTDTDEGEA